MRAVRQPQMDSRWCIAKLIGCLIAAVAIRADIPILHVDTDFDTLARYTLVQVDAL